MNLKQEAPLSNTFYAIYLAIGTLVVPLSSLALVLCVDEATGDEEEEEVEHEARMSQICTQCGTMFLICIKCGTIFLNLY